MKKKVPDKTPWEIMMGINHPKMDRARFFSLNTIAAVTGCKDLTKLLKEMKESGKVVACMCPIVNAPVFFVDRYGAKYGIHSSAWDKALEYIEKYPFPKVQGFQRYKANYDSATGGYTMDGSMPDPFIKEDYAYANMLIDALKEAGYKPRLKPYKLEEV